MMGGVDGKKMSKCKSGENLTHTMFGHLNSLQQRFDRTMCRSSHGWLWRLWFRVNQNNPKALKLLIFSACAWECDYILCDHSQLFFCSFCFKLNDFKDFIKVQMGRVCGAGLHRPIIYSLTLTWIFQTVAHLSLSRCWQPSWTAFILRDTRCCPL